jgi:hypothetical protein
MEPVDLWERHLDPAFKDRAPRRLNERRWDIRTVVEGAVMASMPGGDWPALSDAEEKALFERYAEEIAQNFAPATQVQAMDKEGLDLAVLYPTIDKLRAAPELARFLTWVRKQPPSRRKKTIPRKRKV